MHRGNPFYISGGKRQAVSRQTLIELLEFALEQPAHRKRTLNFFELLLDHWEPEYRSEALDEAISEFQMELAYYGDGFGAPKKGDEINSHIIQVIQALRD